MNAALKHFDMTGRKVLIAGGATGIGLAMTRALAGVGAQVLISARREDLLKQVADELNAAADIPGEVSWHPVDLNDRASTRELAAHATEALGGVDVFIGNAGNEAHEAVDELTDDAIDNVMRVNVTANMELTRDLLPHMRARKWGRFVYCSSAASLAGSANDRMSVYGAAKAAINGFARYVAAEAGHNGITANALIVGLTRTEMVEAHLNVSEEARHEFLVEAPAMTMVGRPAQPDELGGIIQLLVSDAGSYMTGGSIAVDGGMSAMLRPNAVTRS